MLLSWVDDWLRWFRGLRNVRSSTYLLIKSLGNACSSKRHACLYTAELICMEYSFGVKVFSMIPPALMRALRAAALMSNVFRKWGTRAWCMGCRELSCLLVAITTGSIVACDRSLQEFRCSTVRHTWKKHEFKAQCRWYMSYIRCIKWRLIVDGIMAHLTLQSRLERRIRI